MSQAISSISFLYLFGGVQALFITIYLFIRKNKNRQASLCLSLILLGLFLTLYDYFILQNSLYDQVSHFLNLGYMFQFAFAPLTYLLIKSIVFPLRTIRPVELLHFVPAILHLLYGIFGFHIYALDYKVNYIEEFITRVDVSNPSFNLSIQVFYIVNAIQLLVYLILGFRLIRKFGPFKGLKKTISRKTLKWFFWSIAGIDIILIIASLRIRYLIFSITNIDIGPYLLIFLSLYLFYVAYFIILNHELFEIPVAKYRSSVLDQTEKNNIYQRLQEYMHQDKPHLKEDLTIKDLGKQMDLSARILSQIINEKFGSNFYDFVNYNRILEAQKLLKNEQGRQFSITGIAYEVGFNSKSSFYSAFKKFTGNTPSEYQKQYNLKK